MENTATKTLSTLLDFDGKPIFNRIQLSNIEEDNFSLKLIISKEEVKIKRQVQKVILLQITY